MTNKEVLEKRIMDLKYKGIEGQESTKKYIKTKHKYLKQYSDLINLNLR